MKRIFILFALGIASFSLYGQRSDGVMAIQLHYGISEGRGQQNNFFGLFNEPKASMGGIGLSYTVGNKGFLVDANLFFQDYYVDKDKFNLPYQLYGINLQGGWSYENLEFMYINLKAGGFIGIEKVNNGEKTGAYGIPLKNSVENFTYGVILTPEIEVKLYRNLFLTLQGNQYWNIGSKYANLKFSTELGLKYYIN